MWCVCGLGTSMFGIGHFPLAAERAERSEASEAAVTAALSQLDFYAHPLLKLLPLTHVESKHVSIPPFGKPLPP